MENILKMVQEGFSIREIETATGVSKVTIGRYVLKVHRPDRVSSTTLIKYTKKRKLHFLNCGYCNLKFLDKGGEKTSDIKRGRIKQAFCTHHCAMNYRSQQRHADQCRRCGKTRKELSNWKLDEYQATGVVFTNGYCPKCQGLIYQYHGDESLCQLHELNRELKEELRNVAKCQEHC